MGRIFCKYMRTAGVANTLAHFSGLSCNCSVNTERDGCVTHCFKHKVLVFACFAGFRVLGGWGVCGILVYGFGLGS